MKELGFYFFQFINERISAKASEIEIYIVEDIAKDRLELIVKDNGQRFDSASMEKNSQSGLLAHPSLKFLMQNSRQYGGDNHMLSHKQTGNMIEIDYPLKDIYRPRLGDITPYLSMLIFSHPKIHFIYSQMSHLGEFIFDSDTFKSAIFDLDNESAEFLSSFKDLLQDKISDIQDLA